MHICQYTSHNDINTHVFTDSATWMLLTLYSQPSWSCNTMDRSCQVPVSATDQMTLIQLRTWDHHIPSTHATRCVSTVSTLSLQAPINCFTLDWQHPTVDQDELGFVQLRLIFSITILSMPQFHVEADARLFKIPLACGDDYILPRMCHLIMNSLSEWHT